MKKYVNNSFINKSPLEYKNGTKAVTSLPVEIFTDGQPVSSYTIKGNTQTSGTPSPQNPVTIEGVGEETANLTDINNGTGTQTNDYYADMVLSSANKQKLIDQINGIQGEKWLNFTVDNNSYRPNIYVTYQDYGGADYRNAPFHLRNNDTVTNIIIRARSDNASLRGTVVSFDNIMLNTGESVMPFEPYGKYKISILKGSSPLTPMYFSQQLMHIGDTTDDYSSSGTATYNIKKLVLTGQESFWSDDGTTDTRSRYRILPTGADTVLRGNRDDLYCTHFKTDLQVSANSVLIYNGTIGVFIYFYIPTADYPTLADFKTYIQQQYAAGTPVTLYYILATPTTETVTPLSIPTTGGTATIDVDTTVKPSEIDLTYHGWHEHQPLKRENGQWV